MPHREHQTADRSHGRQGERHYVRAEMPNDFPEKDKWPGAAAIGMAVRVTEKSDGTTSGDTRYIISSRFLSGERFAEAVRYHWGIENSRHWVLDVTFGEDQCRTRNRRMANNLSWLRRFAISLLNRHPSKHRIKGKSDIAGWNNEFLMEVFTKQGV